MNLLLFVLSMLMLLSIVTYGKLESFRNFSGMQMEFVHFMEEGERGWINEQAAKKYDKTAVSSQEKSEDQKEEAKNSSSKITIQVLVNKSIRENKPELVKQYQTILKNLMTALYGNQPFLKEALEKNSGVLDQLLQAIERASENKKISRPKQLATLELDDSNLDEIFYKMLKGSPKQSEDLTEVYPSLLDFLTDKSKFRLRVYLAAPSILLALYDRATAEEVIQERKRLYREVAANRITADQASEAFQSLFKNRQRPGISDQLLDFSVSKTRPSRFNL